MGNACGHGHLTASAVQLQLMCLCPAAILLHLNRTYNRYVIKEHATTYFLHLQGCYKCLAVKQRSPSHFFSLFKAVNPDSIWMRIFDFLCILIGGRTEAEHTIAHMSSYFSVLILLPHIQCIMRHDVPQYSDV